MSRTISPDGQKKIMTKLMNAGIQLISEVGVDELSVQAVAELASTSRPTFYSYFGDLNGLLAEIWLEHCDEWLDEVSDFSKHFSDLTGFEADRHKTLVELLAVSHRIPELSELVNPRMSKWWADVIKLNPMKRISLGWLVSARLGATITQVVDREVLSSRFIEPVLYLMWQGNKNFQLPAANGFMPSVSEPDVEGKTIEAKLLASAISVIATSGVKNASMARIARRAQVSTGAVYPRFSKADQIIEQSFEVAVGAVVEQNFALMEGTSFMADDFGSFVTAGLGPTRSTWRNFRIEIHIGAKGRPSLASRLEQNLKETNQRVATRLINFPYPQLVAGPVPYLMHSVGIGFAVLLNAGLPVDEIDHRLAAHGMVTTIAEMVAQK